jgi:hypothetical protein
MSRNIICWICDDNLSYPEYEGTKLLDDNGDKPCLQCISEDEDSTDYGYEESVN